MEEPYVDSAREALVGLFQKRGDKVFYERQLQVAYEDRFFHWVVSRALKELTDDRFLETTLVPLFEVGALAAQAELVGVRVRYFWRRGKRYWRRQVDESKKLIVRYSDPVVTEAVGLHAETMFDAAFGRNGIVSVAQNTREFNGRTWEESHHDLDRIYMVDETPYGAEIKNKLGYIEAEEYVTKLRMCLTLGIRPLFIPRMMPKSWIYEVSRHSGYCLIFKHQLYPFGMGSFAKEMRDRLGLPADCPRAIAQGTIDRFVSWHRSSRSR